MRLRPTAICGCLGVATADEGVAEKPVGQDNTSWLLRQHPGAAPPKAQVRKAAPPTLATDRQPQPSRTPLPETSRRSAAFCKITPTSSPSDFFQPDSRSRGPFPIHVALEESIGFEPGSGTSTTCRRGRASVGRAGRAERLTPLVLPSQRGGPRPSIKWCRSLRGVLRSLAPCSRQDSRTSKGPPGRSVAVIKALPDLRRVDAVHSRYESRSQIFDASDVNLGIGLVEGLLRGDTLSSPLQVGARANQGNQRTLLVVAASYQTRGRCAVAPAWRTLSKRFHITTPFNTLRRDAIAKEACAAHRASGVGIVGHEIMTASTPP